MLKRNLRKTWRKEKEKNPRRDDVLNLILYPAKDDKKIPTKILNPKQAGV